jgi:tetratricopeptide (TPR) repeat protein
MAKVINKYQEAVKAVPDSISSVYATHNIADFLQKQGKYKQSWETWDMARQLYERSMQEAKDLGNPFYFPNYGDMLRNAFGKLTEAEKIYRAGLVYDADHAGILIGLVNLHLAKMEDNDN